MGGYEGPYAVIGAQVNVKPSLSGAHGHLSEHDAVGVAKIYQLEVASFSC